MEAHLHFQMMVRACIQSTCIFGVFVWKYMNWFGKKCMDLVGKITYKVLSNRMLHTYKGMIGYCLKDIGKDHFVHALFNVSNVDGIAGKTLHVVYGKGDLKSRVMLTNKNVYEHSDFGLVQVSREATIKGHVTQYIDRHGEERALHPNNIMDYPHEWSVDGVLSNVVSIKCLTNPSNMTKDDIQENFFKKRNYK